MSEPGHRPAAVVLDGGSLTLADLARLARDPRVPVEIHGDALARVAASRAQIEMIAARYVAEWEKEDGRPVLEYGVTTGFGEFKNVPIAPDCLEELQRNILLSHSVGVGETAEAENPANYFEPDVVRAVLAIRLNAFLKGHSGIRLEMVRTVQAMLNRGIVPRVPIRGSVGSSGDLCPLAQLFVVLLGEGSWFVVREPGDLGNLGRGPRELRRGLDQLGEDLGIARVPELSYKDGLALTNGATFSAALLALAAHDAGRLAHTADVAAALSLEAVCGCARAFDARIHRARGLEGQIACAANIRVQIQGSKLIERAGAVQDVYSLRCAPAVHGAARDVIAYARKVAEAEINAATDNPLFFPANPVDIAPPFDHEFAANWPQGYDGRERISFSAGNFHGEPVGMAADVLAIGLAELADISERRTQMLLDAHHNRNLPANLIPHRGINSGLMIAQYCAAGIVSENKVLCHPASVDSIPTSANSEDHNAMATFAARKLRTVLRNVQAVLAIELLVGAQAVEWRVAMAIDPVRPRPGAPSDWEQAGREAAELEERTRPERRTEIASALGEGTRRAYLQVRELVPTMLKDRVLEGDIRAVRAAVEQSSFHLL
ncbi:MAG TPA: aromatic amino acid lyase [Thermoanaerobaculia bacterium]|jgi:histidine ammonia-lyase|nr:aromatic amino acid lyase [Thermoanaerobaculia bacterium]